MGMKQGAEQEKITTEKLSHVCTETGTGKSTFHNREILTAT